MNELEKGFILGITILLTLAGDLLISNFMFNHLDRKLADSVFVISVLLIFAFICGILFGQWVIK